MHRRIPRLAAGIAAFLVLGLVNAGLEPVTASVVFALSAATALLVSATGWALIGSLIGPFGWGPARGTLASSSILGAVMLAYRRPHGRGRRVSSSAQPAGRSM